MSDSNSTQSRLGECLPSDRQSIIVDDMVDMTDQVENVGDCHINHIAHKMFLVIQAICKDTAPLDAIRDRKILANNSFGETIPLKEDCSQIFTIGINGINLIISQLRHQIAQVFKWRKFPFIHIILDQFPYIEVILDDNVPDKFIYIVSTYYKIKFGDNDDTIDTIANSNTNNNDKKYIAIIMQNKCKSIICDFVEFKE